MLFLPAPLRAIIASILYALNTLGIGLSIFIVAFIRYLIPFPTWRKWWHSRILYAFPEVWTDINAWIMKNCVHTQLQVDGLENVGHENWYLVVANHRSWLDILVLQQIFNRKIPSLRFFMKKELLWQLPIVAQSCWILDYPFMKRYSKEFLAKNPHLKGTDVATTRQACEKFKNIPTSIINFIEGGRFTKVKHQRQKSPYRYLLKPKAGGIAFVLATMGEFIHTMLDVTIVYPDGEISFRDFLFDKVKTIVVKVNVRPITPDLLGDYENDRSHRVYFQGKINEFWREKDQLIDAVLQEYKAKKEENISSISEESSATRG